MAETLELLEQEQTIAEDLPFDQRSDVTVEELANVSTPYPAELYDGRIVYKMPNYEHAVLQAELIGELKIYLKKNPIGQVLGEANFKLWPDREHESRIPDLAFIKKENAPENPRSFPQGAPDLAVEIISPNDNFLKVMTKVDEYLAQGAQAVWLVMAEKREVLVCSPGGRFTSVRDTLVAPGILPEFELPLNNIFGEPSEPTQTDERQDEKQSVKAK